MKNVKPKAGVIGWPVEHSLSPRLHNYWLKQYRIEGSYETFAVVPEKLEETLRDLPVQGFRGVNLTVPHKEAALRILLSEHGLGGADLNARFIGAVNTVVVQENGKLKGSNTDSYGFKENLLNSGIKSGTIATVLGAGGAARAVLIVLLTEMGFSEIRVVNRTKDRAEKLVEELGDKVCTFSFNNYPAAFSNTELLINTTSLGMKGQPPLDISLDTLPRQAAVTDIVYAPLMTGLLKQAQERGHKIVDGLGMLLYQAQPGFKAWFGVTPEVTPALRAHMIEAL